VRGERWRLLSPWVLGSTGASLLNGLQGVGPAYDFFAPATRGECVQILWNLAAYLAETRTYETIDVLTAYEQLSTSPEAQLVDVREPVECAETGVPKGALLIPLGEIEQRAPAELAKDEPVYVICKSGNRSRTASEILVRLGYIEVYNVDGGIIAWLQAGLLVDIYTLPDNGGGEEPCG
jgi:rhodanese-related sulfurtransferase